MKLTKKARIEAIREILYAYPLNSEVTRGEDIEHLMQEFYRHPEWPIKEGVGIKRITIGDSGYNNRCFYLHRTDDTKTDISFMQCINGKSSKLSDVSCACRSAIRPTIEQFRAMNVIYGQTICSITGEVLTAENTHIDHYNAPFQDVFRLWVAGYDVDWLFNRIADMSVDNETAIYFKDPDLSARFVKFHNEHTHLRAVSKRANLSVLRSR